MKRYFLIFFFFAVSFSSFARTLRLQCVADLAIRQHKASFSNDFVETNLGKAPVLSFHGIHYIGGPREVASILVLDFDLTLLKSKLPEKATLYLRGKNDLSKMKLVSVSTVSSPWVEGGGLGNGPRENGAGATAHWASYRQQRWISNDPQSELIDVSFGLGNSLWQFENVRHLDNNWI
ncbi:MAG: hypothetical protein GWP06_17940, partial [Actinobacteria bacterium]|nr:hypothetical protein [Actinomycetota bacterium]